MSGGGGGGRPSGESQGRRSSRRAESTGASAASLVTRTSLPVRVSDAITSVARALVELPNRTCAGVVGQQTRRARATRNHSSIGCSNKRARARQVCLRALAAGAESRAQQAPLDTCCAHELASKANRALVCLRRGRRQTDNSGRARESYARTHKQAQRRTSAKTLTLFGFQCLRARPLFVGRSAVAASNEAKARAQFSCSNLPMVALVVGVAALRLCV